MRQCGTGEPVSESGGTVGSGCTPGSWKVFLRAAGQPIQVLHLHLPSADRILAAHVNRL